MTCKTRETIKQTARAFSTKLNAVVILIFRLTWSISFEWRLLNVNNLDEVQPSNSGFGCKIGHGGLSSLSRFLPEVAGLKPLRFGCVWRGGTFISRASGHRLFTAGPRSR